MIGTKSVVPVIYRPPALRYGSGRSKLKKPNRWLFAGLRPDVSHPKSALCRLVPPSLRQVLKRWVAAAKEIFICCATE